MIRPSRLQEPVNSDGRQKLACGLKFSARDGKGRESNLVRHSNMASLSHSLLSPINIHARETIISQMIESWLRLLAAINVRTHNRAQLALTLFRTRLRLELPERG